MIEIFGRNLFGLKFKLELLTPGSYKILGELQTIQGKCGLSRRYYVDYWPDFSAIIAVPGNSEAQLKYLDNIITCFAVNKSAMKNALTSENVLDWSKTLMFAGFPCKYADVLNEVITSKNRRITKDVITEYVQKKAKRIHTMEAKLSDLPQFKLPDNMNVRQLKPADASIVQDAWEISSNNCDSEAYIKWTIETQPTLAVYSSDDSEEKPVAFMLGQYYGTIGMLHVNSQFRGKGIGKFIVTELAKQTIKIKGRVYVNIECDNEISYSLHKKCGFLEIPDLDVVWKAYTPPCSTDVCTKMCI